MFEAFSSSYGSTIIQLALLNLVALVAPGSDFAIVSRNSILYGRKIGIYTALGITLGELFHLSYIILGAHIFIVNNIWVLNLVKGVGCLYLLYLGYNMIISKDGSGDFRNENELQYYSAMEAIKTGALTNALNPKAIMFFISIFSVVIDINTPLSTMVLYGIVILITTFSWFAIVAIFFTHKKIRDKLLKVKHWIERFTGVLLILIGIKLAFTTEL